MRNVQGQGEVSLTADPAEFAPVRALKEKTPATVGDIRQMLGFLSCYRPFIRNISRIAHPLYNLLTVPTVPNPESHNPDPPGQKHKKAVEKKKGLTRKY